ncbi:MAG TPA: PEP/pyruvate-binding domain-containing protein [Candidatus Nanoarchaeia archaeon]|nr:PEP/pyruvate-binding domain-containing protein [Candidatus Nanoarchaeia archaeon]
MEFIIPLTMASEQGIDSVGIRALDLDLLRGKLVNIPPSWVLTAKGFSHFLDHNHLRPKLKQLVSSAEDENALHSIYQMISDLFEKAEMPADLVDELEETCVHFRKPEGLLQTKVLLDSKKRPLWLLIPSPLYSGDPENKEGLFLNVRGLEDIISKLKQCWASLFSPSEILARRALGIQENPRMGVVLQQMIVTEVSGVAYALMDKKETVKLRACWGLPDYNDKISMDEYTVTMDTWQITSSTVDTQLFQWGLDVHTEELIKKPVQKSSDPKLVKKEVLELAKLAKRVRSYGKQDVKMFFLMDSQLPFVSQMNRIGSVEVKIKPMISHTPPKPTRKEEPATNPEFWLELSVPPLEEKKQEPRKESPPKAEMHEEEEPESIKEIVEESKEGEKNREALLDQMLKAKELIYEIEYLLFKNEKEKFATKLEELKKLIGGLE